MKEIFRYLFVAILFAISTACGKTGDEPSSNYDLNRQDIIGEWYIKQAKFDKAATMTDWDLESTTFTFKENGYFETSGYFGNGSGSFSIEKSKISTTVNNQPYVDFVVNGINEGIVDVVATILSSQQTVWMTWYQPTFVPGGGGYQEWTPSEESIRLAISGVYSKLAGFVVNKQAIEEDIISGHFGKLSPSGSEIMNGWGSAYETLYFINEILGRLNTKEYKDLYGGHIAHLRALRGYIAYHLATLWGKARYERNPHEPMSQPPVLTVTELLQVACQDLEEASTYDYSLKSCDRQAYLNPDACQLLLGEITLTLGNKDLAKEIFGRYANKTGTDNYFEYLVYDNNGNVVQTIPIYTKMHPDKLAKEAAGQLGGLIQSWRENNLKTGYWQMLKRLGNAESVTGCQTYQLLFPYPWNEISDGFAQNEGY